MKASFCLLAPGLSTTCRLVAWVCVIAIGRDTEAAPVQGSAEARVKARSTMQETLEVFVRDRSRSKAKEGLLQCIREDPSYAEPRYNLGKLAESEQDWDAAIRWLSECQSLAEGTKLYDDAGQNIQRLKKILDLCRTPNGTRSVKYEIAIASGRDLISAKQYGEALAALKEAIRLDESRYEAHSLAGAAKYRLKEYDQALDDMDRAITRAPGELREKLKAAREDMQKDAFCEKHLLRAADAMADGKYEEAAIHYDAAWKKRPAFEGYALRAALGYQLAGRPELARNYLRPLTASKDLAVAQSAADQLLRLEATNATK